jgi:hypothetical protein
MSAFEDFIQRELPKRGYLDVDVPQESIIVRRGPGARQFDGVTMTEGQVLAMVNGVLTGTNLGGAGGLSSVRKFVLAVASPETVWTIEHNLDSENVIIQAFDENKAVILPDLIRIIDENTVELQFSAAQAGTARVIFLD